MGTTAKYAKLSRAAERQTKPGLLNSWKEIAVYVGRGVRTVQRWEQNGLPVRRVGQGPRSPVIASTRDIDVWMRSALAHGFTTVQSREQLVFRGTLDETVEQSRLLRDDMQRLREGHRQLMLSMVERIKDLEKTCALPPY